MRYLLLILLVIACIVVSHSALAVENIRWDWSNGQPAEVDDATDAQSAYSYWSNGQSAPVWQLVPTIIVPKMLDDFIIIMSE